MERTSRVQRFAKTFAPALTVFLFAAAPAWANVGLTSANTFSLGLFHPLSGIDHIIAMVAVGLFAANLGGRALWLVPSAFVGTMIFGGLLGYYGWPLPMVEQGIGLSVVAISLAVAVGIRLPTIAAMAAVGVFAIFHGHAHGNEGAGLGMSFLPYAAGFIISTALLHVAGIAAGLGIDLLKPSLSVTARRVSGTIGALAGMSLLLGWVGA